MKTTLLLALVLLAGSFVPQWGKSVWEAGRIPVRVRAMVVAWEHLVLAGPPDVVPESAPFGAFEGRLGALLWVVSTRDGRKVSEYKLPVPPVFDGMAADDGKLDVAMVDGKMMCLTERK